MAPDPEQVDVVHHVAAQLVGEEVHAEQAIEDQQETGHGEGGKGKGISTLVQSAVQQNGVMRIRVMPARAASGW